VTAPVAVPPRAEPLPTPKLAVVGLVAGLTSGLLGVGGGIVIVPLLVYWAGHARRDAHAWSLGAIAPIAIVGLAAHGVAGEVQLGEAGALAAGALVGARIGARTLARSSERTLKLLFGMLLVATAIALVVRS